MLSFSEHKHDNCLLNTECLPGYFGTNCKLRCFYPGFGKHCMNTCDCNRSDCDPVSGCQGNDTEIQITAGMYKIQIHEAFNLCIHEPKL